MESIEELRSILESFVVKGGFQGENDWKKVPQQHNKGSHLVYVTREDVIRILNRYLAEEYPAEDVDIWADGILQYHFSGYVGMENGPNCPLFDIIEELAISAEEDLTPEDARRFIEELRSN